MKQNYNWWKDPKNKEEVDEMSWWDHPENQRNVEIPIAIIKDDKYWVASTNDKTKELLGDYFHGCTQSDKSEEDAIKKLFEMLRWTSELYFEQMLNYQRCVPFRHGPWGRIGGHWFAIFGIHVYFRYGKNMQGGWYVPFTKLNISMSSEWVTYKRFKKEKQS